MNLFQAAEKGIRRLHAKQHGEACYIRIDIVNGIPGPWLRFFTPNCQVLAEEFKELHLSVLNLGVPEDSWEEYTGPRSLFDREELNYLSLRE